jgi:hypothetical protein
MHFIARFELKLFFTHALFDLLINFGIRQNYSRSSIQNGMDITCLLHQNLLRLIDTESKICASISPNMETEGDRENVFEYPYDILLKRKPNQKQTLVIPRKRCCLLYKGKYTVLTIPHH